LSAVALLCWPGIGGTGPLGAWPPAPDFFRMLAVRALPFQGSTVHDCGLVFLMGEFPAERAVRGSSPSLSLAETSLVFWRMRYPRCWGDVTLALGSVVLLVGA